MPNICKTSDVYHGLSKEILDKRQWNRKQANRCPKAPIGIWGISELKINQIQKDLPM
jgi:hypothetical protein